MDLFTFVFCFLCVKSSLTVSGLPGIGPDGNGTPCPCGKRLVVCPCACRGNSTATEDLMECCLPCPQPKLYSRDCFPGDVTVLLDSGETVKMKNLVAGQKILAVQNGKRVFSEVRTFLHRQPASNTTFVTLITEQGHRLSLTELHIVFTSTNTSANLEPTFAKSVKPGDYVFDTKTCSDDVCPEQVVQIFLSKKQGLYAPLTDTGTVVVNGILASCFCNVLNQDFVQNIAIAPFRWFPWLLQPWQEDGFSPILSNMETAYKSLVHYTSWLL